MTDLSSLDRSNISIRVPSDPIDWLEASALMHDYVEWLRAAVGVEPLSAQPSLADELHDLPAQYGNDRSTLFLAYLDRLAVGTVAIRTDGRGGAELKRMYLRPVARGLGLADRLVERAVEAAAGRGCRSIWLESLPEVMAPALAVYRRNGFVDAPNGPSTIAVAGMVTLERRFEAEEVGGPAGSANLQSGRPSASR